MTPAEQATEWPPEDLARIQELRRLVAKGMAAKAAKAARLRAEVAAVCNSSRSATGATAANAGR